ncbi:MAG TPA: hypothetical protein VGO11_02775 [Chthoniobacteraceae bacterium]|nr:hypothetical protein [Chthoniobacteraceae bacterium]
MKFTLLLALVATALFTAAPAGHAGTFYYPTQADAWFSIEIPDAWKPKVKDETIEATAPKDAAYVTFWVLTDVKDFASLPKDIAEILKDSVTNPKITKKMEPKTVNGIEFKTSSGTGLDRKEKTPVSFEFWLFSPKPGKVGFLYFDRDTDASPEIMKALEGIVGSIKKK